MAAVSLIRVGNCTTCADAFGDSILTPAGRDSRVVSCSFDDLVVRPSAFKAWTKSRYLPGVRPELKWNLVLPPPRALIAGNRMSDISQFGHGLMSTVQPHYGLFRKPAPRFFHVPGVEYCGEVALPAPVHHLVAAGMERASRGEVACVGRISLDGAEPRPLLAQYR